MLTLADTKQLIQDKGVEFFLCSFVEMSGAPKAKLVPATHVDDMASGSAGFAGFATGEMGQGPAQSRHDRYARFQHHDGPALAQKHRLGRQ